MAYHSGLSRRELPPSVKTWWPQGSWQATGKSENALFLMFYSLERACFCQRPATSVHIQLDTCSHQASVSAKEGFGWRDNSLLCHLGLLIFNLWASAAVSGQPRVYQDPAQRKGLHCLIAGNKGGIRLVQSLPYLLLISNKGCYFTSVTAFLCLCPSLPVSISAMLLGI